MKSVFKNPLFVLLLRFCIGGVFLYAGLVKMGNPHSFADNIVTFELLPVQLINLVALVVPVMEVILGLLIISGLWLRPAFFGIIVLTAVFILALAQGMLRGLQIDCGCFGSSGSTSNRAAIGLAQDLLIIAASGWLYFLTSVKNGVNTPR